MAVLNISDQTFESCIKENTGMPVLVDFWAPWCGPCKSFIPTLDEVAEVMQNQVKVCKIDIAQYPEQATRYDVRSIPTLMIFKNGQMMSKVTGSLSKENLISWLNEYICEGDEC